MALGGQRDMSVPISEISRRAVVRANAVDLAEICAAEPVKGVRRSKWGSLLRALRRERAADKGASVAAVLAVRVLN